MAERYYMYISVMLTVIALTMLVLSFFQIYNFFSNKEIVSMTDKKPVEGSFQKIIDDLDKLVQRKCYTYYKKALEPYVNKRLKTRPLINDDLVNKISVSVTADILEEMSDDYREKLTSIYKEEMLNDVILKLVYDTVTEMSMSINKKTIKKTTFAKSFESISKTDFDD